MLICRPASQHRLHLFQGHLPSILLQHLDPLLNRTNQCSILTYNRMQFGTETFARDFNPKRYKVYPWLDFSIPSRKAVCFACERFLNISDFAYCDWKHGERGFIRHQKNPSHELAMEKWIAFREMERKNTNITIKLQNLDRKRVQENRAYLRVIIECLALAAQQNIAQRGHRKDRTNKDKVL